MLSYSKVKTAKKNIRALVLTPTRELAIQIEENFNQYSKDLPLKSLVVFGGVGQQPQRDALKRGVDVLIATPGRLLDLYGQGYIDLKHLEFFVLDEADRMLDMGFIHDVKKLIKIIPEKRQTLFFSATMPPEIQKLANHILVDPIKVEVTPESTTAEKIQQEVYYVKKNDKKDLLIHILKEKNINHVLVFSKTKHGADRIVKDLAKKNIQSAAIHGNKSQSARQNALKSFKDRTLRVLVATDIAARGIDIDELAFVINYDLPNIPESYVHRIGRTGRAGKDGQAISFCDEEEYAFLLDIQKSIRMDIPLVEKHPYALHISGVAPKKPAAAKKSGRPASTSRNGQSSNHGGTGANRRRTSSGPRSENRNRSASRRRDS
ncbi:ATP-dependent RNA helicase RhlE [compost metagenome]